MAETFSGKVEVQNTSNQTTIELDGNTGDAIFKKSNGEEMFRIDGSEGDLKIKRKYGTTVREVFRFDASAAALYIGCTGNEGDLRIRDTAGKDCLIFDANYAALYIGEQNNEGDIIVRDNSKKNAIHLNGGNAEVLIGTSGREGYLRIRDAAGRNALSFDGNSAYLAVGTTNNEGDIRVMDNNGRTVFDFDGKYAALRVGANGNEGDIIVKDDNGNESIHLNGGSGDIILRNADAAEHFDVEDATEVTPGMAMVLGENGKLKPCSTEYDRKAIGVVAGAGNYKPGILMDSQHDNANRVPVSVLGKVSCKVDATIESVSVGDLLTTSANPGHAMKATDDKKLPGTIIGKALTPLNKGVGYVDMLVMQQ